ncbi:UDP-Glycosyltransferase superfamily protein [Euphorbia peplus]|nr:UDP-Glycosyltransferase superfamily protein [Euphorbia peplus]
MASEPCTPHIAILPSPGMGHLIPLVELAKRLVLKHNLSITFIIPTNCPPSDAQKSVLRSLPGKITSTFLPPVDLSDIPSGGDIETIISLTVARSLSPLRNILKSLQNVVALVVDLFGTDAFDVVKEFNLLPYVFFPSTAMALSLFLYLPKLDQIISGEYRDVEEPIKIPGCIPVRGKDLLDPVQDRKNDAYKWVLHHAKRYKLAQGIMVNSFMELEGGAIKAIQNNEQGNPDDLNPAVYPVGPLVNMDRAAGESECLNWLDQQPLGSVLYVSFGSGGTLLHSQITELALGLEMSDQRFLWVVKSPSDVGIANEAFFSAESAKDPLGFLPKGFLDRTKGRGFVVPSWAPQAQVLSHGSTGGFLTHCGWNSTLESVVNGVPLIAWPLFAEQKMNAVMLTEDIKIALRPKREGEKGIIGREEIANVVRTLMEGEDGKKVRNKIKDLKDAASYVLSENGSSTKAISELVNKWQNHQLNSI